MRLDKASPKAIRYAVMNWHYSKTVPQPGLAYSVFEGSEFCGVVCFNLGVNGIESPFNLPKGTVIELSRVALNNKQQATSQVVAIALRLVKKDVPLCDIVVSYADSDQGHYGTIYQASNWTFVGSKKTVPKWVNPETGESVHNRSVDRRGYNVQFGKRKKCSKPEGLVKVPSGVKHKYCYALSKTGKRILQGMAKAYPKPAHEAKGDEAPTTSGEKGGAGPTRALNKVIK